jgi:transposase InsO family protein
MARRDGSGRQRPKTYTDDFKRDAVRVVTEQRYSIAAAAKAVGVSDPTRGEWLSALRQAIESRRPIGARLFHHSDQGCQYTGVAYRGLLHSMTIECSMSRLGACHDKTRAERFFWSVNYEWTNHLTLSTLQDARRRVFDSIVAFSKSK